MVQLGLCRCALLAELLEKDLLIKQFCVFICGFRDLVLSLMKPKFSPQKDVLLASVRQVWFFGWISPRHTNYLSSV